MPSSSKRSIFLLLVVVVAERAIGRDLDVGHRR
jgi:hypothetical protein